jgi:REP element-mobilizing transposase RayT
MQVDPDFPVRRRIRLPGQVYSAPGSFFVTICTWRRACVLGRIIDHAAHLSACGIVSEACWREIPAHFPCVELDAFVVMPNHVHGIIHIIGDGVRATHGSPLPGSMRTAGSRLPDGTSRPRSLGTIVGSFKAAVTRRVNDDVRATHASPLPGGEASPPKSIGGSDVARRPHAFWQRGYYDHVIRDEAGLLRVRQYILDNPARWAEDPDNIDR